MGTKIDIYVFIIFFNFTFHWCCFYVYQDCDFLYCFTFHWCCFLSNQIVISCTVFLISISRFTGVVVLYTHIVISCTVLSLVFYLYFILMTNFISSYCLVIIQKIRPGIFSQIEYYTSCGLQ